LFLLPNGRLVEPEEIFPHLQLPGYVKRFKNPELAASFSLDGTQRELATDITEEDIVMQVLLPAL